MLLALPSWLAWPANAAAAVPTQSVAARTRADAARLSQTLPRTLLACGLPPASLGLHVAEVDSGTTVASFNAEAPFVMASTAKLVTSQAALDLLGVRWRWRTHAFATGPVHEGRLLGDLMIVGGGDPQLSSADLRQWLHGLRHQGLDEIRGDLVVDRSAFLLHDDDHAGTPVPGPGRPHHAWPDGLVIDAGVSMPAAAAVRGVALAGPASPVAQAIDHLWRDVGGRLRGRLREGDLSAGRSDAQRLPLIGADGDPLSPLSTHLSPLLPQVLYEINKTSNNLAARHLLLSLARGFPARPATLAAARDRLQGWLLRQGLGPSDIEIDNGSGLSRAERSKPRALVHLLRRAWAGPDARAFVDSLPVAGVDGTLAHRLQGGAAMGQAHLKTGSLLDTRALAGYVRSRSGRVHALAMFVNHPAAAGARPALDQVIETLARHG